MPQRRRAAYFRLSRMIKLVHAADFHLDSPFSALSAEQAAQRRAEQRQIIERLADFTNDFGAELLLLAGDLFDSALCYAESEECLCRALGRVKARVFISPGNHDYYSQRSPWARMKLPENVHVFSENAVGSVLLPELNTRVYGAAFIGKNSPALLTDFHVIEEPGVWKLLCLHGELGNPLSPYDPITEEQLAESGLHYAALGHIHKASGLRKAGDTWYAWPGCPEGRGFDECGEKTVNILSLDDAGGCELQTASIASRRYEVLSVDVAGTDPLLAVITLLPDDTVRDIYRIVLTGETESAPDLKKLYANLSEMFFELQLRDETRLRRSVWECAGEDSLRGIFLKKLRQRYDGAANDEERKLIEQAARWGLAALNNAEEVVQHEDP